MARPTSASSVESEPRPPHFGQPSRELPLLAIDSTDLSVFEALKAGLATYGWTCVWQPRHRPLLNRETPAPATAAIYDGAQLDDADLEALKQLCNRMSAHNAPVIALLDFPRVEHLAIAQTAGAAAIFAKPYQLALLHNELMQIRNRFASARLPAM